MSVLSRYLALTLSACVLCLIGCEKKSTTPHVLGPPPQRSTSTANAVDQYRSLHASLSQEMIDLLDKERGELSPEMLQLLQSEEVQAAIVSIVETTKLTTCDWGIDYSDGLDTDLPHLGDLRRLTWLLKLSASLAMEASDTQRASECTASIVRLSQHVGGKSMIEAYVAIAVLDIGNTLVMSSADQWSKSERNLVLAEVLAIDQTDLFDGDAKIKWEKHAAAKQIGYGPSDRSQFDKVRANMISDLHDVIALLEQ
ncbi:MAG: hypothetical protein H6815_04125 [Phycisphaeraceae bacterium]|nr:hypothetical protein [Phycisphaerales bacterium]MCB9859618.1 hypothetical protein [Phycisphaeraceae bacterium]